MIFEYMKKHRRVILVLLIAAVIIAAVILFSPPEPEQEFHGTFIMKEDITHRHLH